MAILGIFSSRLEEKCDSEHFQCTLKNSENQIKTLVLWECVHFPIHFQKKANFKFVINPKIDFSGGQNCKNFDFETKLHFLEST